MKKTFTEHLEQYLGKIEGGWDRFPNGEKFVCQIIEYKNGFLNGIASYSTLGLSDYHLTSVVSKKRIKHELLMCVPEIYGSMNIPGILQQLADEAIKKNQAYLRGELIGPRGFLFINRPFVSLYVTIPTCFPDAFFEYCSNIYNIAIAWLIPITQSESDFCCHHGWSEFEKLLEKTSSDLFSLDRESIV